MGAICLDLFMLHPEEWISDFGLSIAICGVIASLSFFLWSTPFSLHMYVHTCRSSSVLMAGTIVSLLEGRGFTGFDVLIF